MRDLWWERDNPFMYRRDDWFDDEDLWLKAEPKIVKISKAILSGFVAIMASIAAVVGAFYLMMFAWLVVGLPTTIYFLNN